MTNLHEFKTNAIWTKEYPIRYAGTRFNSRMTIVRLTNGKLLIHSPCKMDDQTKAAIDGLGIVKFIIAPGSYHYFNVRSAQKAFPQAETFICPGIELKDPNIKFDWILGDQTDARLSNDFEQLLVRGNKYMWEVAFYFKPSKTLILVDLIENFTDKTAGVNWSLKLWWKVVFRMWNTPKPAPEYQLGWTDKKAASRVLRKILAWDFENIIISHGDIIEQNAKQTALRAWRKPLA